MTWNAPLEVIECEQGSAEWLAHRAGVVTASEFATVMAKGKGGSESKTRRTYMLKLIGEILTGEPAESYSNKHMERGKEMEAEARDFYALMTDANPVQVGFLKRGRIGCSPDSLIGDKGAHEIKTKLPHLHLEALLSKELPAEHRPQCQGVLAVSDREWIDFQSYWPRLQPFIVRVYRDEEYIKQIKSAVDQFLSEMDELMHKITNSEAA